MEKIYFYNDDKNSFDNNILDFIYIRNGWGFLLLILQVLEQATTPSSFLWVLILSSPLRADDCDDQLVLHIRSLGSHILQIAAYPQMTSWQSLIKLFRVGKTRKVVWMVMGFKQRQLFSLMETNITVEFEISKKHNSSTITET